MTSMTRTDPGDYSAAALEVMLRAKSLVLPNNWIAYGYSGNFWTQKALSLEQTEREKIQTRLASLRDDGWPCAWLIRLEWSRRAHLAGVHRRDHHDQVHVTKVPLLRETDVLSVPLSPDPQDRSSLRQFKVSKEFLSQMMLERIENDEPVEDTNAQDLRVVEPGAPMKDRSDESVEYVRNRDIVVMARRHRSMERALKSLCQHRGLRVTEDLSSYDALIEEYTAGRDLLVEIKTSCAAPFVRMAIGQLLDYRRMLNRPAVDLAVLLPGTPERDVAAFLKHVDVRLMHLTYDGDIVGL